MADSKPPALPAFSCWAAAFVLTSCSVPDCPEERCEPRACEMAMPHALSWSGDLTVTNGTVSAQALPPDRFEVTAGDETLSVALKEISSDAQLPTGDIYLEQYASATDGRVLVLRKANSELAFLGGDVAVLLHTSLSDIIHLSAAADANSCLLGSYVVLKQQIAVETDDGPIDLSEGKPTRIHLSGEPLIAVAGFVAELDDSAEQNCTDCPSQLGSLYLIGDGT